MIFRHFGLILLFVTSGLHGLHVTPYGLYEDIVIEISEQVPRQKCQRALDNLEVSFFTLLLNSFLKKKLTIWQITWIFLQIFI